MVRICLPVWFIIAVRLISPKSPAFSDPPGKHLKIRPRAAGLYQREYLIRLPGMFSLNRTDKINLGSCWFLSSIAFPFYTKKQQLCYVPEIKTYSSAVRLSVFSYLFPYNLSLLRYLTKVYKFIKSSK